MSTTQMQTFEHRLRSFSSTKRVKNPSLTASSSVKWPHPASYAANPNSLAEAGFYFNPSWDDRDAVTCFMCGKELSDWTQLDDPFDIHWDKCSDSCVWAVVRCGLKEDLDSHGRFVSTSKTRLPAAKPMEKARLATFTTNGWWPHDAVKKHGANSKKMAHAGFVYTPQIIDDGQDDTASCLYCKIALGGWDPQDNPLEEHRQRANKSGVPCPFFFAPTQSESLPATATSSRTKAKKSVVEASEGDDEPSDDELELAPPAPKRKGRTTLTATKSKADDGESGMRRVTRGAASRAGSVMEEEAEAKITAKSKGKGRGRKKPEVIDEDDEGVPEAVVSKPKSKSKSAKGRSRVEPGLDAPEPKTRPSRSKSRANVNAESESDAPPAAKPASKPKKSTTSKPTSKAKGGRKKTVVEEAGMDVDEEGQGAVEAAQAVVDRKGKGMKVVDISTDDEGRERAVAPEPEPERKTRKEEKKKAPVEIEQEQPEPEPMDIHPAPSTPPRPVFSPSPQAPTLTNGHHRPPSPAQPSSQAQTFLPPLALLPIPHIVSLSETEQDMTVEEWIRHEISLQYEQLKSDGETRINAFRERAEEVRRRIDAL